MKIKRRQARDLFKSDIFRDSEWIAGLCEKVGELFVTDDDVPYGHFCMYFGVHDTGQNRGYSQPERSDLRTLHELTHWVLRYPITADNRWLDWVGRRTESEFSASVESECMVYFHIPGLRELVFPHHIWVDRFMHLKGKPMAAIIREIEQERRRALGHPKNDDWIEFQIHNYAMQNMAWCRIWSHPVSYGSHKGTPAFRVVEEHLNTPGWVARHQEWLDEVSNDNGLPFAWQADEYRNVVEESNRLWGNQFLLL